jgi:hypothetical protein
MLFSDVELQFGESQTQMKETMATHLAEVGITTTIGNIAIGEERGAQEGELQPAQRRQGG